MKRFMLFLWIYLGGLSSIFAQQVLLQGFYWDYPKTGQGYWNTFDFANDVDEFNVTVNASDFNSTGDLGNKSLW